MHAVAVRYELRIPHSRSLKEKRRVLRPLIDGLRHRLKVSVAEVDHQDTWQRAAVAVALVASSAVQLDELRARVDRLVDTAPDMELLDVQIAWPEPA
ncbi:MAG: DUF503 domain-containing protein [Acidimicrobiia bacterium]|nr:DUF503 domain-containing protein [Acidimicrobiia bacterium]